MSAKPLSQDTARQLIGKIFIYEMPFNRELGLELGLLDAGYAELTFKNHARLVGNAVQNILHGGVIASVLDVAAGLVCVNSALIRFDKPEHPLLEPELRQRLSTMGTIDLRVDYLRPGRGEDFVVKSTLIRAGNKVSVARVDLFNETEIHIATATATYLVG